jgi:hypothetical protein
VRKKPRNHPRCRPSRRAPDDDKFMRKLLEQIQANTAATVAGLAETNARLAETNAKLDDTNTKLEQLTAFTVNNFTALGKYVVEGFESVDRRFVEMGEQLAALQPERDVDFEARLRAIENHLGLPHGNG